MSKTIWLVKWVDECDLVIVDSAWTNKKLAESRADQLKSEFETEDKLRDHCLNCPYNLKSFESLSDQIKEISQYCKDFNPVGWNPDIMYSECKNSKAYTQFKKTVLSLTEVELDPIVDHCTNMS